MGSAFIHKNTSLHSNDQKIWMAGSAKLRLPALMRGCSETLKWRTGTWLKERAAWMIIACCLTDADCFSVSGRWMKTSTHVQTQVGVWGNVGIMWKCETLGSLIWKQTHTFLHPPALFTLFDYQSLFIQFYSLFSGIWWMVCIRIRPILLPVPLIFKQ